MKIPNIRNAGICEFMFVTNAAAVVMDVINVAFAAFPYVADILSYRGSLLLVWQKMS